MFKHLSLFALLLLAQPASAADEPGKPAALGVRRALIVCGLPGDADHRKTFGETVELLYQGLTANFAVTAEQITVLWGDEANDKDGPAVAASQIATREAIQAAAEKLRAASQPDDALWVFVLGHAHYDGKQTWLNIKGPDLSNVEFGKLFSSLACREQVFFITTPVSGFFARSLSSQGRVVITATEADLEVNETQFPHKLARNLAEPPAQKEFDRNQDGKTTLLDLYLLTCRDVLQDYVTSELLATEHALLDDNGDGRATEIQLDYLPEELGGRLSVKRPLPQEIKGDGALADTMQIQLPPPKPAEKSE